MQTIDHRPAASAGQRTAFLVGQDGEGHWLAVETHGLGGGIFATRDGAVRYARDCIGDHAGDARPAPEAVRFADGPIRLFAPAAR